MQAFNLLHINAWDCWAVVDLAKTFDAADVACAEGESKKKAYIAARLIA